MHSLFKWAYKRRANFYAKKLLKCINKNEKVLDIGAGSGYIAKILSSKANITLIDIIDYNQTDLPLKLYDGTKLPFGTNSFDAGIITAVLHHTPNPEKFLEECKRVCKRIIIIDEVYSSIFSRFFMNIWEWFWNKTSGISTYYNFHSDAEWNEIFNNLHLKVARSEDFRRSLATLHMKCYILEK